MSVRPLKSDLKVSAAALQPNVARPKLKLPPLPCGRDGRIGEVPLEPSRFKVKPALIARSFEEAEVLEMIERRPNPMRGGFPLWFIWSFEVHVLLKKYLPNHAAEWGKEIFAEKATYELMYETITDSGPFPFDRFMDRAYLEKREQSYAEVIKDAVKALRAKYPNMSNPEVLELIKLLESAPTALKSAHTFPMHALDVETDQEFHFSRLLELVSFLDRTGLIQANRTIHRPPLAHFSKSLQRFNSKNEKAFFEAVCSRMNDIMAAISFFSQRVSDGIALDGSSEQENARYLASATETPLYVLVFSIRTTVHVYKIYQALWKAVRGFWSEERVVRWVETRESIQTLAKRAIVKEDLTRVLVINLFRDKELAPFYKALLPLLKRGADEVFTRLNGPKGEDLENDMEQYSVMSLMSQNVPEMLVYSAHFHGCLLKLDGYLSHFNSYRRELFKQLRGALNTVPLEVLLKHRDKLIESIRSYHAQAAIPQLRMLQLVFNLAYLKGEEQYAFSAESFVGDDASEYPEHLQGAADYLALAGLEKVFDQAIHDATPKKEIASAPEPRMADLPKAVSHQAPKPTASKEAENAVPPKAKAPAKALPGRATVAAGSASAAAAAGAGKGVAKAIDVLDMNESAVRVRATSNDRRAVLQMLFEAGFEFWGFGGNHPLYRRGNERPVPVPLHSKTISHGVVHMLEKAAAGVFKPAPTPDTKDQKRKD